jgi:thiol-disulfide isomerase/thioredoxin
MKRVLVILFIVSLCVNAWFIYDNYRWQQREEYSKTFARATGHPVDNISWDTGFKKLKDAVKLKTKSDTGKKYYYVNIWTTWCGPCVREMPWLDSIAGKLRKDIRYIFASPSSESTCSTYQKKYKVSNFIYLGDMSDFISAVCTKKKIKNPSYPMVLILNSHGDILHYSEGAYVSPAEAADFEKLIGKLE